MLCLHNTDVSLLSLLPINIFLLFLQTDYMDIAFLDGEAVAAALRENMTILTAEVTKKNQH